MSKTNDTSSDVTATSERELTAAELETVTGGTKAEDNKHQADAMKVFAQALQSAGSV
jgi:hypothetical protein